MDKIRFEEVIGICNYYALNTTATFHNNALSSHNVILITRFLKRSAESLNLIVLISQGVN